MSNNNNTAALLMRVYGDAANPLPSVNTLAADIKFDTAQKIGESFNFPVRLGLEQGATYNIDHSAYTLNSAVDGKYGNATLDSAELTVRANLSYGEMTKLSASKGRSSKAYDQGIGLKIANMLDGAEQRREMALWYGAGTSGLSNIGVINAVAVAASSGVVTVNITQASWITGFWQMAANVNVDVYSSGGTQRNTNAALQVTGVDPSKCRVQLTGNTSDAAAVQAGDYLFFYGGRTKQMVGIQAICENTGSLFGIDAGIYPQWRSISYSVGGALNFDKVSEGVSQAIDNGLEGSATLYVPTRAWSDLLNDEVALRRYMGTSGGTAKPGFGKIEFEIGDVTVRIRTHRYLKQGLAFLLPLDTWHRIGSTDLTTTAPGNPNEYFFRQLDGQNGAEIRCYSDQAVVCDTPYHTVMFTGLASSADNTPS